MRKWVILGYDTVVPNVANIDADTPRYPVTVLKKNRCRSPASSPYLLPSPSELVLEDCGGHQPLVGGGCRHDARHLDSVFCICGGYDTGHCGLGFGAVDAKM
jgi:hypothetical protein